MRPRQLSPGAPAVPGRYQPWPQRLQGGARAQSSSGAPMFTLSLSVPLAGATPKQPPGSRVGPGRRARAGRGISCSPGLSSRSAQAGAEGPPVPVVTSRHQPAPADPPISPPRPPPNESPPSPLPWAVSGSRHACWTTLPASHNLHTRQPGPRGASFWNLSHLALPP